MIVSTRPLRRRLTTLLAVAGAVIAAGATVFATGTHSASAAACNGYVGLTYDDGPTGSTSQLLNALRSNGVRATMFNVGQNVAGNPGMTQQQVSAGMWVANHSYTHAHLTQQSQSQMQSELSRTQDAIRNATGQTPRLFRPPYGETNGTLRGVESSLGLTEVLWDVDSQDWNGASTAAIVQAAGRLQNGQVILMHDGIQNTINAIPQIMQNLTSRNLCPGMISPQTGRAVAPDGGTQPTGGPTSPQPTNGGGGSCTATIVPGTVWGDRYNTTVNVSGSSAWIVTVTLTSPQQISTTWNANFTWSASNVATVRPNGSGNSFGFTTMMNGNSGARPSVSCRTS
ncbi:acetylxylan esterase [Virgisporangium aliadipatigenens]|uniref:Acetylxylan esterase n=1 Tax=Virgisporangium aliadipatigenens TaxID=741659 RepID=A0A8J3YJ20_9ACTN|nr:polysaccharide deacetylase family protein [Virgisporangium aliadipatigenens]GIJ45202.1 acetylxylan esterase [Virgisporangium aliadipatigenens]